MSPKKDKRPLQAAPVPLNTPFDGLTIQGLPTGTADEPQQPAIAPSRQMGRVVLRLEKAHRGGKSVVVVDEFSPSITPGQIEEFARNLRKACGCGGTVKDRRIEMQGEQVARIRALLETEGFRVDGVR